MIIIFYLNLVSSKQLMVARTEKKSIVSVTIAREVSLAALATVRHICQNAQKVQNVNRYFYALKHGKVMNNL